MKKHPYRFHIDEQVPANPQAPPFEGLKQRVTEKQKLLQQRWLRGGSVILVSALAILVAWLFLKPESKQELASGNKEQISRNEEIPVAEALKTKDSVSALPLKHLEATEENQAITKVKPVAVSHIRRIARDSAAPIQEQGPVIRPAAAAEEAAESGTLFHWSGPEEISFSFDATKGAVIYMGSGAVVSIPPGALELIGKPVTGKALLQFREFHHAADYMTAGISVAGNDTNPVVPAGAFEIRFLANGWPAEIAADKEVRVYFKPDAKTEPSGAFHYHETAGAWSSMELEEETARPQAGSRQPAGRLLSADYRKVRNPLLRLLGYRYHSKTSDPAWIRTRDLQVDADPLPSVKARDGQRIFSISATGIYGFMGIAPKPMNGIEVILQRPMPLKSGYQFRVWTLMPATGQWQGPVEQWPLYLPDNGQEMFFIAVSMYGKKAYFCRHQPSGILSGWEALPLVPRTPEELRQLMGK